MKSPERSSGLHFSFAVQWHKPEDLHERVRTSRCVHTHIHTCAYVYLSIYMYAAADTRGNARAFANTKGSFSLSHPFIVEARRDSDVLVSRPGLERRRRSGGRGSERGSRDRKEYNSEERDAKRVTLASFQDSAAGWDTYICQSSREGNASPTFTGASHREAMSLCRERKRERERPVFLLARISFLFSFFFIFRTNFPASL